MRGAIVMTMNNVTYLTVFTLMTMCLCVQLTTGDTDADGAVMEDTRVKREALPANYSQIHTFVDKAQGLEESDLILLIDRSKAMTKRGNILNSDPLQKMYINMYLIMLVLDKVHFLNIFYNAIMFQHFRILYEV